ncbi:TetR/AcrR family transcriptional regulator [Zafaria sp. Z1313]|uniref:TetR/AcrR family transcriptional regulator n=1 Tax=Zafaria sp. Z1313 TaxID=3423202 RepID=UPI003D30264D
MTSESGNGRVRERTRERILRAALPVLAQNPQATMGAIADAAGVARSTLHRYYPDRASLREGLGGFVEAESARAAERARPGEGTGLEAIVRLLHEYLDLSELFIWWWSGVESRAAEDCAPDGAGKDAGNDAGAGGEGAGGGPGGGTEDYDDAALRRLVERGHADGSIDSSLPSAWITSVVWSMLYGAWEFERSGAATRHEVREFYIGTLTKVLAPAARP